MSYLNSLYEDLIAHLKPEFDEAEVRVDRYRGELGTVDGVQELMAAALRKSTLFVQLDGCELQAIDTTMRVVMETDTFSIIVCASNQRSEEAGEEDALLLVDTVRTALQGTFPDDTISGIVSVDKPWQCQRVMLNISVPGLTTYTVTVTVTVHRDMDA